MPRISKLAGWTFVLLGGFFSVLAFLMAVGGIAGWWLASPGDVSQPNDGGTIPGTSYLILMLFALTVVTIGAQFIWWSD